METKGILQSKVTWGVILAALAAFVDAAPELQAIFQPNAAVWVQKLALIAGLVLAAYGRYAADTPIQGVYQTQPKPAAPSTATTASTPGIDPIKGSARVTVLALLAAAGILLASFGCATAPVPQAPGESIAAAEAAYTTVLEAATTARDAGLIDDALAARLTKRFDEVEALLDAVEDAYAKGDMDAGARMLLVLNSLIETLKQEVPR